MLDDNFDTEELFALLAAINPYAGRNSKLERSLRARAQLRDDEGKWIFMGGGSRANIRLGNGSVVSTVGRSAGASSQQGKLQMYVGPGSADVPEGFYLIDSTKTRNAIAILPGSVPTAPYSGSATDSTIVNLSELERLDAPEGWTKNETGSYMSADGEFEIRPDGKGGFDLYQNNRRVAKDLDNPATALSRAAKIDIQGTMDKDTKKVVARLKKDVTAARNLNKDNVLELEQDEIDKRIKDAEDKVERALFNDPELVGKKDPKQEALNRNLQDLLSDADSLNKELEQLNADYDALENKRGSDAVKIRKRRNEIKAELENNAEDLKAVQDELDLSPESESDVVAEIPEETDAEAPTEAPAAKKAAPLDNMRARVEEIKNEIASLEQSGNSKENRDKIAELQAEKKTLEDNIAILSPTEDKQLDIPETKTPTAEEVNREPAPGEGPTPEEEAAEWKPSNEPTRYFINGQELDEAGLEDYIRNAKDGEIIYMQTQKDGKPILERYVKNNDQWLTFTGKLDDLYFDNDGMIDFIGKSQNMGSIVANNNLENMDAFPEDIKAALDRIEAELNPKAVAPRGRKRRTAWEDLTLALDGTPLADLPPVQFDPTAGPDASWVSPNQEIGQIWPGDVAFVDGKWRRLVDRNLVETLVPSSDPKKEPMTVRNYTYTFEDGTVIEEETVNGFPRGETAKKYPFKTGLPVAHIDPRRRPKGANREQMLPEGAVKPAAPEAAPEAQLPATKPKTTPKAKTPAPAPFDPELNNSPVGTTLETADGGWTKYDDDLWASDDTGETITSDALFVRSGGEYLITGQDDIIPETLASSKEEFDSRMAEAQAEFDDKLEEATGLGASPIQNISDDMEVDFNDEEDLKANIELLDEKIEAASKRLEELEDSDNFDEIATLDDEINDLEDEKAALNSALKGLENRKRIEAEKAAAEAGPKTKQEADQLIANTEARLKRIESSPDGTEARVAFIKDQLDKLKALRDTLPEGTDTETTTDKKDKKDGRKPAGAESGRKGKVSGKVERPAPSTNLERRGNSLWDRNRNVAVGTAVAEAATADTHRAQGRHVPVLFEVPQTEAEFFRNRLIEAAASNKHGASVTIKPLSEYQKPGVRMFITQDGGGGVALDGDEIVTGFMHDGAADKGNGSVISMVDKMVELGGRRLDAFDTILPKFYAEAGFRAVARLKFNPKYAPTVADGAAKDWNEADYEKYNNGQPDVVFMVFDPNHPLGEYSTEDGEYVDDYDKGLDKQAEALAPIDSTVDEKTEEKTTRDTASVNQEKQRILDELTALQGSDGLMDGDVPKSANGNSSAIALREAQLGQVIEYKFANGKRARFIKVSRDVWKRADKADDFKSYRSGDFTRDKTLKFVPTTSADKPSYSNEKGVVDRYRPNAYRIPKNATDQELERLKAIYQDQADNDPTWNGSIRAGETVYRIERMQANRRGEPMPRRADYRDRIVKDVRERAAAERAATGETTAEDGGQTQRKTVADLLSTNNPIDGFPEYSTDPYTPENPGGDDDPEYLATVLQQDGLKKAFATGVLKKSPEVSIELPDGTTRLISIEAARDTLQRMGVDTNVIIDRIERYQREFSEETAEDDSGIGSRSGKTGRETGAPGTWSEDSDLDRIAKHANRLAALEQIRAGIAVLQARNPNDPKLAELFERAGKLRAKIIREQELGIRNVYAQDPAELKEFNWGSGDGDVVDPNFIMEALIERYGDRGQVMPNGDLKLAEVLRTDKKGNSFKYELFITKTDDNTFYSYVRQTNLSEPDETKKYTSVRTGEMRQSARAAAKQADAALAKMGSIPEENLTDGDILTWFQNKYNLRQLGITYKTDTLDADGNPVHAKDRLLTQAAVERVRAAVNREDMNRETIQAIFELMQSQRGSNEESDRGNLAVLLYLQGTLGFSQDEVNSFVDAINEGIEQRDRLQRYTPWHDADETPMLQGDRVQYVGGVDKKGNRKMKGTLTDENGVGLFGVVRQRLFEFTAEGSTGEKYTYTDYVHVDFFDANGNIIGEVRTVSANNLKIVETAGGTDGLERTGEGAISLPMPRPTVRAFNRWAGQNRLNHFAPFVSDYKDLTSPTVNVDGVDYPVQASRAKILSDNLKRQEVFASDLQVGDFIPQFDEKTQTVRLAEVVGITTDKNGNREIITVVPRDLGSADVSKTSYPFGVDPLIPSYRENVPEPTIDPNVDPLTLPVTKQQRDTLAALLRTIDTGKLSPGARERAVAILNTENPEDLDLNGYDVASIIREINDIRTSRGDSAMVRNATIEETVIAIDIALREGSTDPTTLNNLERIRRAVLARGWDLGDTENIGRILDSPLARQMRNDAWVAQFGGNRGNGTSTAPRRNTAINNAPQDQPYESLPRGPYGEDVGVSTLSKEDLKDALRRGDKGAVTEMLQAAFGNRIFGKKHRLTDITVGEMDSKGFSYGASIVDDEGNLVGGLARQFFIDSTVPRVDHSSLAFFNGDSAKRTGFAKEFKKVSDNFYNSLGLKKIDIFSVKDGKLAWARMNYTWADEGQPELAKDSISGLIGVYRERGDNATADKLQGLLDRLNLPFLDENFPDPIDLGYVKDSNGNDISSLIMDGSWAGVRYLDPALDPRPENRQKKDVEEYKANFEAPTETPTETPVEEQPATDAPAAPEEAPAEEFDGRSNAQLSRKLTSDVRSFGDLMGERNGWSTRVFDKDTSFVFLNVPTSVVRPTDDPETAARKNAEELDRLAKMKAHLEERGYVVELKESTLRSLGNELIIRKIPMPGQRRNQNSNNPGLDSSPISNVGNDLTPRRQALEEYRKNVDPANLITDPESIARGELPVGSVIKSTTPWGGYLSIKTDNGWQSVYFNSTSELGSDDKDMAENLRARISQGDVIERITDPNQLDKIQKFAQGQLDVVEPTSENFSKAVAEKDFEALSSMFYHTLFNGGDARYGDLTVMRFNSEMNTTPDGKEHSLFFYGDIVSDQGDEVGTVERKLYFNSDTGEISMLHSLMRIDDGYKGTGFSSQFSVASEDLYRKLGIDLIQVTTAWDGSYVWAKAGYEWDTTRSGDKLSVTGSVMDSLADQIEKARDAGRLKDSAAMQDILDRMQDLEVTDPNFPSPSEIAGLQSEDEGYPQFARDILTGTDWLGLKRLGGYGKSGEQIANEQAGLGGSPTSSVGGPEGSNEPIGEPIGSNEANAPRSFDNWDFVETKQYTAEAVERAVDLLVRRHRAAYGVDGGVFTRDIETKLRKDWTNYYETQFKDSYIYRNGNYTLEIQKDQIDSMATDDAVEAFSDLMRKYPLRDDKTHLFRLTGEMPESVASDGAGAWFLNRYVAGEFTDVITMPIPKLESISAGRKSRDGWHPPAGEELHDKNMIVHYYAAHEYGHMFDFSNLKGPEARANIPNRDRDMSLLSISFKAYIERVAPELWSKISRYANSYAKPGEKPQWTGPVVAVLTKTLENFAEAFAQMASEDFYGASPDIVGKLMRDFLAEMGIN